MTDSQERDQGTAERWARYRWAAEVSAGGRVLDAACGAGWGTVILATTATEAVGVDLSPAAIADARREHGGARFVEGDLRSLPFESDEFEHVACFEALAHFAEPEHVLDELTRVLKPGGTLLASAPNPDVYPAGNPLHLSEIAPEQLERLLSARFANVAVHPQHTFFASLLGEPGLDPASGAPERAGRVAVLGDQSWRSALHAVAIAGNRELPAPPDWLVLGEAVGYEEQRRLLESWQDRAVRAEAEVFALRRQLRELQS